MSELKRIRIERRVAFADTDAAGIAHFSRMLCWVEEAETSFLREQGHKLYTIDDDGAARGFPKVGIEVKFLHPVRFDERVLVELTLERIGRRSLNYRFQIVGEGGEVAAEGQWAVAHVEIDRGGKLRGIELPPGLGKEGI